MTKAASNLLIRTRKVVLEFFHNMANRTNVSIRPMMDEKILNLCSRLYDETSRGRRLIIDLNQDSDLDFDWFVKTVEFESTPIRLLSVFVRSEDIDLEQLWDIYKSWIHARLDPEKIAGLR